VRVGNRPHSVISCSIEGQTKCANILLSPRLKWLHQPGCSFQPN